MVNNRGRHVAKRRVSRTGAVSAHAKKMVRYTGFPLGRKATKTAVKLVPYVGQFDEEIGSALDPLADWAGVKKNRRVPHSRVQSLVFDRRLFTPSKAKLWAKRHGFRYGKVDEKPTTLRLRQFDPSEARASTYGTITMTRGVLAVVAVPKKLANEHRLPGMAPFARPNKRRKNILAEGPIHPVARRNVMVPSEVGNIAARRNHHLPVGTRVRIGERGRLGIVRRMLSGDWYVVEPDVGELGTYHGRELRRANPRTGVRYSASLAYEWIDAAESAGDTATVRRAKQALAGNKTAQRDVVRWEAASRANPRRDKYGRFVKTKRNPGCEMPRTKKGTYKRRTICR